MQHTTDARSERYLRFSQRGMAVLLALMVLTGAGFLSVALQPEGLVARWMPRLSTMVPIAAAVVVGALVRTLRGDRWDPRAPEALAIMEDEWRRTNMGRAMRGAFIVIVVAQVPLGLVLHGVPSPRAVMAMAVTTMTLGMATLIALFLFFGREAGDGA